MSNIHWTRPGGMKRALLPTVAAALWVGLGIAALSGLLMFAKLQALPAITRLAYTGFEVGLILALSAATVMLPLHLFTRPIDYLRLKTNAAPEQRPTP